MVTEEALLTVPEVAARLRVSHETVKRWLRAGKLRGVLIGGPRTGYRIRASEIDAFIHGSRKARRAADRETQPGNTLEN